MCVVTCDDIIWDEEEGGSGVSDGGEAFGYCTASADGVASAGEAPEALGVVDGGIGDAAGVSAGVDVAEVVAAWFAFLQVGCEDGGVEEGLGVGEEGLLFVWGDGVDGGEGQAEESVALVLGELGTDCLSQFYGLACDGGAADVYGVSVDIAAC